MDVPILATTIYLTSYSQILIGGAQWSRVCSSWPCLGWRRKSKTHTLAHFDGCSEETREAGFKKALS